MAKSAWIKISPSLKPPSFMKIDSLSEPFKNFFLYLLKLVAWKFESVNPSFAIFIAGAIRFSIGIDPNKLWALKTDSSYCV